MQAYTTTFTAGQWVSQTLRSVGLSQTVVPSYPSLVLFRFVWQESPPLVAPAEPNIVDEKMLAQLYAEFADEDRALANAGLADYTRMLSSEDTEA